MTEFGRVITQNEHNLHNGNFQFVEEISKRKIPLGTKGRTSILSIESSASCGVSFSVSRRKLHDLECCVTPFRQGGWSRLPARSALQSVKRFEVSTGDPRPLAPLTRLSLHTHKNSTPAVGVCTIFAGFIILSGR